MDVIHARNSLWNVFAIFMVLNKICQFSNIPAIPVTDRNKNVTFMTKLPL